MIHMILQAEPEAPARDTLYAARYRRAKGKRHCDNCARATFAGPLGYCKHHKRFVGPGNTCDDYPRGKA